MSDEIASAALQRVLGIDKSVLSELAQRGIVKRGSKRGSYKLEASVSGYLPEPERKRDRQPGRPYRLGAECQPRARRP